MATTSTPKKPLSSLLLLAFFFTTITQLLHSANSQQASFTFPRFNDDTDLIMQGASSFSRDFALQLTDVDTNGNPLGNSIGRTICTFPVPFWNRTTGRVATISTSFVLNITSPNNNNDSTIADGIAFFIASFSTIPSGSGGEFLGIFSNESDFTNFVAVEFDTYPNVDIGDPNYRHVGIDVNSVLSLGSADEWEWRNGELFNVTISYDPLSQGLSVLGSYSDGSGVDFTREVDLTTVLPEWGFAGFSATTGEYSQVNHVDSWSFSSILGDDDAVVEDMVIL